MKNILADYENYLLIERAMSRNTVASYCSDVEKFMAWAGMAPENVTAEDVIYDYAYASVEHSLRFDFLSYIIEKNAVDSLKASDIEETIRIIDGYVSYYADQYVNQMELK